MTSHIKHLVTIDCPPNIVYKALTTKKGIQGWWTEDTVMEPKIGAIAEFKFGDEYHIEMDITQLEPTKRVTWVCIVGDPQWVGTDFTFDLEYQEGQTLLRFGHNNWDEQTDFYAQCNFKWGYYLQSLKTYCETGIGNPVKSK